MDRRSSEVEQRRFDVRRKGYDQAEVTVYLHDIAETMAELEAAARAAELRAGRLERDLHDTQVMSENGFHQLVATNTLAHTQPPASTGEGTADAENQEAERIFEAAADHAERLTKHAEAKLEDVLATTAAIEADQERLLAEASADRDLLLTHARASADEIVAGAKQLAAATRADAQRFAGELRELTAAETIELVTYAKEMAAAILETTGRCDVSIIVEDDAVTVDLRNRDPGPDPVQEPTEGLGRGRPSRYEARSANLPRMGEEQATEAMDSIESLRDRLADP